MLNINGHRHGKSGYFGLSNFLSHMLLVDSDPGLPGMARPMSGLLTVLENSIDTSKDDNDVNR